MFHSEALNNIVSILANHLRACTTKLIDKQTKIIQMMRKVDSDVSSTINNENYKNYNQEHLEITKKLAVKVNSNLNHQLELIQSYQKSLPSHLLLKNLKTRFPLLNATLEESRYD